MPVQLKVKIVSIWSSIFACAQVACRESAVQKLFPKAAAKPGVLQKRGGRRSELGLDLTGFRYRKC